MEFELWMVVPIVVLVLSVKWLFFSGSSPRRCSCGRYLQNGEKDKCAVCLDWEDKNSEDKKVAEEQSYEVPCTVCAGDDENCLTCNGTGKEVIKKSS